MRAQPQLVQPPRIATWLVNLFTQEREAEAILGDLQEEFAQREKESGSATARCWYWREALKTIGDLTAAGLNDAPWSTAAAAIAGFLVDGFAHRLPDRVLALLTDRYLAYWSNHFNAYVLCATDGMFMANVLASVFVGCVVALVMRQKEMIVTLLLAVVLGTLGMVTSLLWLAKTGDIWMLALQCADTLGIVVGGIIVRTHNSARTILGARA
jgi:hypothetical protein